MRRVLTVAALVAVAALALVAAGCGGDDEPEGTTAAEWADSFCSGVTSWLDELGRIREGLGTTLTADALEQAADEASTATEAFVEEMRDLGAPETESGQAVEDAIESLADTAEAEKAKVEEAVEDAAGLTETAAAVAAIGTSISAMATALQTAIQALEDADASGELETALEESAACDEISGG